MADFSPAKSLRLDDFLAWAGEKYYAQGKAFGKAGDFITAPEISQLFGEIIGLWAANLWLEMGSPSRINIIELGPGRGTLMVDFLRAAQVVPGFRAAISLHLVEKSSALRAVQGEKLQANWYNALNEVPEGDFILIANEFFDALPIRQFLRHKGEWWERWVEHKDGAWGFAWEAIPSAYPLPQAKEGEIVEVCEVGLGLMDEICIRLGCHKGGALIIDYGYSEGELGDTLQAVSRHQYVPVLSRPGKVDLTAHVNFKALKERAGGVEVLGPIPQGPWLYSLGLEVLATRLANRGGGEGVLAAVRRLTHPEEMGQIFKVLEVRTR